MDDADELERIRAAKRERLRERIEGDEPDASDPIEVDEPDASDPIEVEDEAHFRRLLADHDTLLVDFYADWCGPCRMLEPILETVAAETPATVAKVDTETHVRLTQQHGVRGLPTLVLYVDGEVAQRLVGMQDEGTLRQVIDRHHAGAK